MANKTFFLEGLVRDYFGLTGDIFKCQNSKEYQVKINDIEVKFNGPETETILVPNHNKITEVYYKIVTAILFDHFDISINKIQIGSHNIHRAEIWKTYESFESKCVNAVNRDSHFSYAFESTVTDTDISSFDSLVEYLNNENSYIDEHDLAEMISPTMRERLLAELTNRRLIKDAVPTASLF